MKDLLSKKHYCYKVRTLLMKSIKLNHSPPSTDNPAIWITCHPQFHIKILSFHFYDFSKISIFSYKWGKGSHYEDVLGSVHFHKISFFTNERFSKMHCLEYHYSLIPIIIIIIVIIIIIIMVIMVMMIIILIISMMII